MFLQLFLMSSFFSSSYNSFSLLLFQTIEQKRLCAMKHECVSVLNATCVMLIGIGKKILNVMLSASEELLFILTHFIERTVSKNGKRMLRPSSMPLRKYRFLELVSNLNFLVAKRSLGRTQLCTRLSSAPKHSFIRSASHVSRINFIGQKTQLITMREDKALITCVYLYAASLWVQRWTMKS